MPIDTQEATAREQALGSERGGEEKGRRAFRIEEHSIRNALDLTHVRAGLQVDSEVAT